MISKQTLLIVKTSRRDWLLKQLERYRKQPEFDFYQKQITRTLQEIEELNKIIYEAGNS